MQLSELAPHIEHALRATRGAVLEAFGRPPAGRLKADGSTVTDLDLELERWLAAVLLDLDPAWGVVGEEGGEIRAGAPTWHLDPIDGTANFARRSTLFASQLVLMDGTVPLFAAVYEPLLDDYTYAVRGGGAWREGVRLRALDPDPAEAVIYADLSKTGLFMERPALLRRLRRGFYKLRLLGSIALHLRNVAAGVAEGYLSGRGHPSPLHDLAPGTLLCREAGVVTSDGRGDDPLEARDVLVAGTPRVHDRICEILDETA